MANTEKNFADGFVFKRRDNAPDFVVGNLSVKVEEAIAWLKANHKKGWVNIDVKQSKGGNYYCEQDTWEPKTTTNTNAPTAKVAVDDSDDLPF